MNALKNDNQLDLNNRKEEASTDINALEQRILDLNSKFTLLIGDTRAALETNKWIQTRRSIGMSHLLSYCQTQAMLIISALRLNSRDRWFGYHGHGLRVYAASSTRPSASSTTIGRRPWAEAARR